MDAETGSGDGKDGRKSAPKLAVAALALFALALLGGAYAWMRAAGEKAALSEAPPAKGPKRKAVRDATARTRAPADTASPTTRWVPMSKGREDRGFNLSVAWDDPHGAALRERARNLAEGYAREPGRLQMARRRAVLVHPALVLPDSERVAREDLPLERVQAWFAYDPFEEWTVHSPGGAAPFRPTRFRLVRDSAAGRPAAWSLWAHVSPGVLFAYRALAPALGNAYLDRASLALGPVDTVLGREHFETLTGGPVDSILLFSLTGRPWQVAEVHGRRSGRTGAWTFLVDPDGPRAVLLAHDFDRRPCPRDKRIRFRAALDVNGDGRREILLGPYPSLLFFEDGDIFSYLQEEPAPCEG